jgi:hypothetical protein
MSEAKNQASNPLVQRLEQVGLIVRGLIYFVIGYLAFQLAMGNGGQTANPNSAIEFIGRQPFGKPLLLVIAVGLVGYSLWGFVRAFLDPLHRGKDTKGLIDRAGFLVSGISYALLVVPTMQSFLNKPGASAQGNSNMLSSLMTSPWNKWLIIVFGLVWLVVGVNQLIIAHKEKFMRDLKKSSMSADEYRAAVWTGKLGHAARGIVFILIGIIVFQTIFTGGAQEPLSFDGALAKLSHAPNGEVYLAAVAIGLILFGVYSALCAKWIKIDPRRRS